MAGYREHISVSGVLGVFYGAGVTLLGGFSPAQGVLCGCLTWIAGMLPDVDSESGRPIREVFGLLAAAAPFLLLRRFIDWTGGDAEATIVLGIVTYILIRYGGPHVLSRLSVHRGMFHSVPALIIAAEAVFLGYKTDNLLLRLAMAGGVAVGFLSHLILDELYSVEWTGIRVRLRASAGSALKFVGKDVFPNLVTYSLLMVLTYAALVDAGLIEDPSTQPSPQLRQATEELPERL